LKRIAKSPWCYWCFLETAHPIKFLITVEPALNIKPPIPKQIESVLGKGKLSTKSKPTMSSKPFRVNLKPLKIYKRLRSNFQSFFYGMPFLILKLISLL
jgi:hypothetical protein